MYQRQKIKSLTQSLSKLTRVFVVPKTNSKVKTVRVRTLEKQAVTQILSIQKQLQDLGYRPEFLKRLFDLKCQQNMIKPTQTKYTVFIKGYFNKILNGRKLNINDLNLKQKSAQYFLNNICKAYSLIGLDISNIRAAFPIKLYLDLIDNQQNIAQLKMRNLNMQPQDLSTLLQKILQCQKIVYLDISNKGSQHLNRFGEGLIILQRFLIRNKTLIIFEIQGLSLKQKGLQAIQRAFKVNQNPSLLSLNLRNNHLGKGSYITLKTLIGKSNLHDLNLSQNPLGSQGIQQLVQLKYSQLKKLNLSNIGLDSKGFISFLQKLKDNKDLQIVILDRNDLSNNWFVKVQDLICDNKCIKQLSLIDCRIKNIQALFDGLIDNTVLIKLNINQNQFDNKYQEMIECLEKNTVLQDLKMKFCGINTDGGKKIAHALTINRYLKYLDISENSLTSQIGKFLLTTIYSNSTLLSINLQKTQIDMATRKFIQEKLHLNQIEQIKRKRTELLKQNTVIKQKDVERKQNLQIMKEKLKQNEAKIISLRSIVESLSNQVNMKKKSQQEKITNYDIQVGNLNKMITKLQIDSRPIIKELEYKISIGEEKIIQSRRKKEEGTEDLVKLEKQLKTERQKIKELEHNLEIQFQNLKYLNRKKSFSLPKLQKRSTLMGLSRKSSQIVEIKTAGRVELKLS